jgi:hypothetical protein
MVFIYSLLFRDNVPTIVLNQWEITADYLEDDLLDGVMPVLFADDVKAAEAAISEAPLNAKRDLERLAKMYFVPETLDLTQAEAVVRKPRLGEVIFWYKNLNLERLFAEDRLAAAYTARNRAALQEAAAASNGGTIPLGPQPGTSSDTRQPAGGRTSQQPHITGLQKKLMCYICCYTYSIHNRPTP